MPNLVDVTNNPTVSTKVGKNITFSFKNIHHCCDLETIMFTDYNMNK